MIINHHESINAKFDDILWGMSGAMGAWFGILEGVQVQFVEALLVFEAKKKSSNGCLTTQSVLG